MGTIHLEEINPENWRYEYELSVEQKTFVSDPYRILARAFAYKEHRSKALVIYSGDTPIGMAMYYDLENMKAYDFSQFFIDKRYQGQGYGKAAASAVLEMMKADSRYKTVVLCYIKGNEAGKCLYESLGFKPTGEADGDEIVMKKEFD